MRRADNPVPFFGQLSWQKRWQNADNNGSLQ
jgi:hypothetical protein